MATLLRLLIVEDQPDDAELLVHELLRSGFEPKWDVVDSRRDYVAALEQPRDIILADYNLPAFDAISALRCLRELGVDTPLIVVTGSLSDDAVVQCLKEGAADYLLKDRLARLGPAITQALARQAAREEQRRLEDQLRHSQKLESVGRLAGGIAHDFNNLLTVIRGNADLALAALPVGHPIRRELEGIRRASDRAADLTRQMLAFSRKQVLQPRVIKLNDIVSDMGLMIRRLIGEDIHLVMRLQPDIGPVKADPGQLEQVMLNLAVNARDAMPNGGTLCLETATVEVDEAYARTRAGLAPGPHVILAISDTGTGMDEATKARLFEPFFTTKPPGKGTGLGLATVYGIIKQTGGHVWVYTELGYGTTFKIFLPTFGGEAEMPTPAPSLVAALVPAEGRLLVAEDEDAVRELLVTILERHGYSVLSAANGEEALKLLSAPDARIDLLVTDVVMPSMGGRALYDRLHAAQPGVKVLYLSGYTEDGIVHGGILDPGTAFLQKPFTSETFLRKVRDVLEAPSLA